MKMAEINKKSDAELKDELAKLYKDYFMYKMQKGLGQLGQTHFLKAVKCDIARVRTAMNNPVKVK